MILESLEVAPAVYAKHFAEQKKSKREAYERVADGQKGCAADRCAGNSQRPVSGDRLLIRSLLSMLRNS